MRVIDRVRRFIKKLEMHREATAARLALFEPAAATTSFKRASGEVECPCGFAYFDHPKHPTQGFLTILCNGELVKL